MNATDLLHRFQVAAEARRAEREAFEEYGGYSWGYHGGHLIEAAYQAEEALGEALTAFIDERIAKAKGKA